MKKILAIVFLLAFATAAMAAPVFISSIRLVQVAGFKKVDGGYQVQVRNLRKTDIAEFMVSACLHEYADCTPLHLAGDFKAGQTVFSNTLALDDAIETVSITGVLKEKALAPTIRERGRSSYEPIALELWATQSRAKPKLIPSASSALPHIVASAVSSLEISDTRLTVETATNVSLLALSIKNDQSVDLKKLEVKACFTRSDACGLITVTGAFKAHTTAWSNDIRIGKLPDTLQLMAVVQ